MKLHYIYVRIYIYIYNINIYMYMVVWNTGLSHVHLICRVSKAEGSSGIDEVLVSHSIATPRRDLEGP